MFLTFIVLLNLTVFLTFIVLLAQVCGSEENARGWGSARVDGDFAAGRFGLVLRAVHYHYDNASKSAGQRPSGAPRARPC